MPPTSRALFRRLELRFLGVVVVLAALMPATLGLGAWRVRHIERNASAVAAQKVDETVSTLQQRLTRVLRSMESDAAEIVTDAVVRQVLSDSLARTPTLVRPVLRAVDAARSDMAAVEVYSAAGEVFAWSGLTTPLGFDIARQGIPDSLLTMIVEDGAGLQTLTLWLPIHSGDMQIGAVRVMRRAQVVVPIRNRYLTDFNLADRWRSERLLPFLLSFTQDAALVDDGRVLVGLDGSPLAQVVVSEPSTAYLVNRVHDTVNDVVAFWAALLVAWLVMATWIGLRKAATRVSAPEGAGQWRVWARLLILGVVWWAGRFGLLLLNIPGRWFEGAGLGGAAFDPSHLASGIGLGLFRSGGDLILTVAFAVPFAFAVLRIALRRATLAEGARSAPTILLLNALGLLGLAGGAIALHQTVLRQAILDSTLEYFERSGPIPDALTLLIMMALMAATWATVGFAAACVVLLRAAAIPKTPPREWTWMLLLGIAGAVLVLTVWLGGALGASRWPPALATFAVTASAAFFLAGQRARWIWMLSFRGILFSVLVLAPLAYSVMSLAQRERENVLMQEAADDFARGHDPRTVYALEQVLTDAHSNPFREKLVAAIRDVQQATAPEPSGTEPDDQSSDTVRAVLNDVVSELVSGSFLLSLTDYDIAFAVLDSNGDTLSAAIEAVEQVEGSPPRVRKEDPLASDSLRRRYERADRRGFLVVRVPAGTQRGTNRYAGIGPIRSGGDSLAGWLYASATPRHAGPIGETPYPRVLVREDLMSDASSAMSYSEYDNGVLVRSRGGTPGPFVIDPVVRNAFAGNRTEFFRTERVEGHAFRAYYRRVSEGDKQNRLDVIAVRMSAPSPLDHLFHLFRLTLAGVLVGVPGYVLGLLARRRSDAPRPGSLSFGDRVLSRFLLVGIATVVVTGIVGREVVVAQNRQSVEDLLRVRLQRVEALVTSAAGTGVPVASVLETTRADEIGAQLGIDIHIYRAHELVSTSRPQLVRQRFLDERLPADVYRQLYSEGRRFAFDQASIGTFTYTVGYKAVANEMGRIVGAIAVPTLPEQASIRAGQARMIAYLFGVLLVLMLGIFLTTALLANHLTRPFKRLRAGFKAVGEGEPYAPIPVETKDEMGQLADAFNQMQAQLRDSRARLAQQERELAWREMAQQVAHEIKNPLTPMKLSVQHLRAIYRKPREDASPEDRRFGGALDRITTTLIEQIDALNRIAGEFSSFARLPRGRPEIVDLNEVIGEAAALFHDEAPSEAHLILEMDLVQAPLPIEADRDELRRVYINLFKNALQAMPQGRPGRIDVRTERVDNLAVSEVEDNGAGIAEEVQARIFQPKFSTKSGGMGLGLALVRKTVEEAGGSITFSTTRGRGTTFRIEIPLAKRAEDRAAASKPPST